MSRVSGGSLGQQQQATQFINRLILWIVVYLCVISCIGDRLGAQASPILSEELVAIGDGDSAPSGASGHDLERLDNDDQDLGKPALVKRSEIIIPGGKSSGRLLGQSRPPAHGIQVN